MYDRDHAKKIDRLINPALSEAGRKVKELGKTEEIRMNETRGARYTHCFRTQFFHRAMNRMAKEKGLRV